MLQEFSYGRHEMEAEAREVHVPSLHEIISDSLGVGRLEQNESLMVRIEMELLLDFDTELLGYCRILWELFFANSLTALLVMGQLSGGCD